MKKPKHSSGRSKSSEQKPAAARGAENARAGQGRLVEWSWPVIAAGVGAMIILSLLSPADSISVFVGTTLPQNFGWLALAACAAFASRNSAVRFEPSRLELSVVGVGLAWLIASSWVASSHGDGRAVWNGFWQVISLGSCYYIARALVQFAQVRAALVLLLIVGCVSLSIQGLEQVLVSMPASRAEYLKDPERMLLDQGIDAPPDSPRRKQFEDRLNSPEPFATFALANSLATLLSLGVVLNSGLLLSSVVQVSSHVKRPAKGRGDANWIRVAVLVGMLAVQLLCLLLTRSRTAYLALIVALGVWLILELGRGKLKLSRRALQMGGSVIAVGLMLGLGWLLTIDNLVWSEAPKSVSYRLEYWQATMQMIREHVWTGVGLGNFQDYYPQYKLEQASEIIADPHNWFLDIAATLSLPIALLVLGWLGVTVLKALARCLSDPSTSGSSIDDFDPSTGDRELQVRRERGLVFGLFCGAGGGGFAGICLLSLFGSLDFQITLVAWLVAVVMGGVIWWSAARSKKLGGLQSDEEGNECLREANLLAAVVVMAVALLASGSWQASGIAVPLLILIAMHWRKNLNSVEAVSHDEKNLTAMVSAALACVALLIFIQQTWRPVTQGWVLDVQATAARSVGEQLRLVELAAAADPLDAQRKVQVMQLKGIQTNSIQDSAKFAEEADMLIAELESLSSPHVVGYLTPKMAGRIAFDLAAAAANLGLSNERFLRTAKGFYSQAVERYPSSVELRIQLASVAAVEGDWPVVASNVERAVEVSDRIPHLDKKIAAQQIWLPVRPAGYESQIGYVAAEPLVAWLRTQLEANALRSKEIN